MILSQTEFEIPKMDCPSEEKIIRMALDGSNAKELKFDLAARRLVVSHEGNSSQILSLLEPLGFGAKILSSRPLGEGERLIAASQDSLSGEREARVLKQLLAINGFMFFFELGLGIYAQSTGLIADSLDMFADAAVYGLSLYAVGRSSELKRRSARISGYLQVLLAMGVLLEVVRRVFFGSEPEGWLMMAVAGIALLANLACLFLLSKHRDGEVHMKASWIFSTNDVIANTGVILAGLLVFLLGTNWPDIVIGIAIGTIVLKGGLRILRISSGPKSS